ncbi:hypothetical protein [Phyllobacterium zundukense]|uniref:Uncharacterized protein n=1 Tax=Phyllobacterium zundukense TaxID=1867719 RepID=A0ACD4D5D8_9HYPH|nr:hypothetical protein [Phyllobacterium zundukense]UXN60903.1 hypothetical protein N8E88_31365 [Phyllobacterium zundukense]
MQTRLELIDYLIDRCPIFDNLDDPGVRDAYDQIINASNNDEMVRWSNVLEARIAAVLGWDERECKFVGEAIAYFAGVFGQHGDGTDELEPSALAN